MAGIFAAKGFRVNQAGLAKTRHHIHNQQAFDPEQKAPIKNPLSYSITYRIATGPCEGQEGFTCPTLPADPDRRHRNVAENPGLSLRAGVLAKGGVPDKLEQLAWHVSRPPKSVSGCSAGLSRDRGSSVGPMKPPEKEKAPREGGAFFGRHLGSAELRGNGDSRPKVTFSPQSRQNPLPQYSR